MPHCHHASAEELSNLFLLEIVEIDIYKKSSVSLREER